MVFDLNEANNRTDALCDVIAERAALSTQFHGYQNDPVDLDKDGCFV